MKESCLVVAGEKSGEEHFFSFYSDLKDNVDDVLFYGVGGDEMKAVGVELIYHLKDFSSFGISEVLGKIPFYKKALERLVNEVVNRGTKTAILLDFQGFNLKLAQKLKSKNVKVLYYVAPQAWVWKAWRAQVIERSVHTLFTIVPFEKKWFADRGVKRIIGAPHPILKKHEKSLSTYSGKHYPDEKNHQWKLLLLPGSRNTEVPYLLPVFRELILNLKKKYSLHISLVKTTSVNQAYYRDIDFLVDQFYQSEQLDQALMECDLSVAASGTVTLSTGLFEVPTVVVYKTTLLNAFAFRSFLTYPGPFSLTNIVAGHYVFPEYIQEDCQRVTIENALLNWMNSREQYQKIVQELRQVRSKLTGDDVNIGQYMASVIKGER